MTSKPPENFRFSLHCIVNEVRYSLTLNMLKTDFSGTILKTREELFYAAKWVRGMLGCYGLARGVADEQALNARRE